MSVSNDGRDPRKPVTRQALYELAWEVPMLRIGQRFGVSSSYLARVFTELKVPRPSPGYWAQREFGKSPPRPELPPSQAGDLTEWTPGTSVGNTVRAIARAQRAAEATVTHEREPQANSPGSRSAKRGTGTPQNKPHDLLVGVRPLFLKSRKVENGILRPFKRLLVDVMSSERTLDTALGAAQSLFEALEAHGFSVRLGRPGEQLRRTEVELRDKPVRRSYPATVWAPERPTVVYIGSTAVGLTLFEMTEEVEVVYVSGSYVPVRDLSEQQVRRYVGSHHWRSKEERASGRLCLQAYCPSWNVGWTERWQEETPGTFSSMIPGIVRKLEAVAPELAQMIEVARQRAEEERRRWDEEARQRKAEAERQKRAEAQLESRRELLEAIACWDESRRIGDYLESVEAGLRNLDAGSADGLRDRLRLARELVGALDPVESLRRWRSPDERLSALGVR
jgi:hypothetical protein